MSILKSLFLAASLAFASTIAVAADIPPPPSMAVKSYVLLDVNSNRFIAEENAAMRVEPASLTKVMTAYLTFKALKNGHLQPDQQVPVSTYAWKAEGSRMFIEPNRPVTVEELIHGVIIQSGNDASIALAEAIGGSEEVFAQLMNQEAKRLGMNNSNFMNSTGLPDPDHYTTAHDLAILAAALIQDYPEQYQRLYSVKEYTYNNITQPNRNLLLWRDPHVDGIKTGHTKAAGYCLMTSAKRGDMRLISVVLGATSENARAAESQKLLNYGFQFYESQLVYKAGAAISELKVWKGKDNTLAAMVAEDLYITLPKGEYSRVKATLTTQQPLIAPIKAGQEVGTIEFALDGKVIDSQKLVASKDVGIAGFFGRLWDTIRLWFI
ncbi:MAG: peptidase [Betaproteobacteria bacterium HGW-Betaproteobacteria-1]|jgi:D-alanyl-D-alanine carboxypeptidase (penicillin-binding protein 5/6)|nr:MAG: peptidase [Betaproteobacteria bacterium HGW-Betaproteobacteria-1]